MTKRTNLLFKIMQQYAARGQNKIHTSLYSHLGSANGPLRHLELQKNVCKKFGCRYHEPRPIEMPQMELFTYPDTIQTGGFGIHVEDNSEQSIK